MFWERQKRWQDRDSKLQWWSAPQPPARVPESDGQGFNLVFASERDRGRQQRACEVKVEEGCTKGLRASCSLRAARHCSPPTLLRLLGLAPEKTWEEREACQQQCMANCLHQQQPECQRHAREFCAEAFAGPLVGGRRQQKPAQQ